MSEPTGVTAEPVCPRHPDRPSYVRCQRCDRPACPQCQRQAAVGIQCVDCVREQAHTVAGARTVFGGRVTGGRPVVTLTIIGLCVVVYVLQLLPNSHVLVDLAFAPSVASIEPWRFITAAFVHSQSLIVHILFNMLVLWQVGPQIEALVGRVRFAALFLVSAVGGSVGYLLLADPLNPNQWNVPVVGASGAVFGLFGALVVFSRRLRRNDSSLLGFIAINFALGFVIQNVAWQGHLGGLVTGAALGAVIAFAPARRRTLVQAAGVAGVVVLLAALSLWRLSSTGWL